MSAVLVMNKSWCPVEIWPIFKTIMNVYKGKAQIVDRESNLYNWDEWVENWSDAEKIARAFGMPFYKIENNINIEKKIKEVLDSEGPIICEIILSYEHVTAPKLSSYQKEDGSFVSRPLEDLAPFLSREELKRNMLIPILEEE